MAAWLKWLGWRVYMTTIEPAEKLNNWSLFLQETYVIEKSIKPPLRGSNALAKMHECNLATIQYLIDPDVISPGGSY